MDGTLIHFESDGTDMALRQSFPAADAPQPIVSIQPSPRTQVYTFHFMPAYYDNALGDMVYTDWSTVVLQPIPVVGNVAVRILNMDLFWGGDSPVYTHLIWGTPRNRNAVTGAPSTLVGTIIPYNDGFNNWKNRIMEPTPYAYYHIPAGAAGPQFSFVPSSDGANADNPAGAPWYVPQAFLMRFEVVPLD
jgi:hypothetical protein